MDVIMWKYIVYLTIILIPSLAIAQLEWEYEDEVTWVLKESKSVPCYPEYDEFGRYDTRNNLSVGCYGTVRSDHR